MTAATTELTTVRVPIDSVTEHPQNARRGDVEVVKRSLAAHGQYVPIVVQPSTGHIIKGNHTHRGAKELGWTEIDVVFFDCTDDEAVRIMLADNHASDQGSYDHQSLADLLLSLGGDYTGAGFDGDDLTALLEALNPGDGHPDHWHEPSSGSVLSVQDVSLGEPVHEVHLGQVWKLGPVENRGDSNTTRIAGPNHLVVVSVATGWPMFAPLLSDGALLLPYPGIYLPLTLTCLKSRSVFVQPDRYLAGHLLDKWCAVFGDDTIELVAS